MSELLFEMLPFLIIVIIFIIPIACDVVYNIFIESDSDDKNGDLKNV